MVLFKTVICTAALTLSSAAIAKAPVQPPEPAEHPDWRQASEVGLNMLKSTYFDPGSAQVRWVSGFRWGFMKPLIGKRTFGWVACGNINAKNRFGGYVGERGFVLFVDAGGGIQVGMKGEIVSSCDDGQKLPVNEELLVTAHGPASAPQAISIADEIKKLADLRASGVLTDAEFAAQKAKLLGQ